MTKTEIAADEKRLKAWYGGFLSGELPIYVPLLTLSAEIEPRGTGQAELSATTTSGHQIRTKVLYNDEGVTLVDNPTIVLNRGS